MEFLIRCKQEEWFDLKCDRFQAVLKPTSYASAMVEGWGDHRICIRDVIRDVEISFSFEDPGIQVTFENSCETTFAQKIVEEILDNLQRATGQVGYIVPL